MLQSCTLKSKRYVCSQPGFCAPVARGNQCHVIRGYTEIRSDTVIRLETIELEAFSAVESVFFLNQFEYDRVDFVRVVDLIVDYKPHEEASSSMSIVAIAVAILSFALAAIFLTGLCRKNLQTHTKKKKMEPQGNKKRFLLGSVPRKYYELDEEQGNGSGFKMVIMQPFEAPAAAASTTWSVSDITSDSASILSNLSRTTSKLARIEEEDGSQTDDEWDGTDVKYVDECYVTDSIPLGYLYDLPASPRDHVDQWDVDILEEGIEPEGCRYLEDSSDDEDGNATSDDDLAVTDSDATPGDRELDRRPSFDPNMIDALNTSDDTVETSNETRAVLQQSMTDLEDEIEGEHVQKWLVELVKELRKAQSRKLLTYMEDE